MAGIRKLLLPWTAQPQSLEQANSEYAPSELWVPALSGRSVTTGIGPTTEASFVVNATPRGLGAAITATGRRYGGEHFNGQSAFGWLIVAHKNAAALSTTQSLLRKNGTLTPVQQSGSTVRGATWVGGVLRTANYASSAWPWQNNTHVFMGRGDTVGAEIRVNTLGVGGGSWVSVHGTASSLSSTASAMVMGASETGTEVASDWTILLVANWYGTAPTREVLETLGNNPWDIFEPAYSLLRVPAEPAEPRGLRRVREELVPWTAQPQEETGIDWTSPLTSGLLVGWNAATRLRDQAGKCSVNVVGANTWGSGELGQAFLGDGSNYVTIDGLGDWSVVPGYTCVLVATLSSATAEYSGLWSKLSTGASNSTTLLKYQTRQFVEQPSEVTFSGSSGFSPPRWQNKPSVIGMRWAPGTDNTRGFINGVFGEAITINAAPFAGTGVLRVGSTSGPAPAVHVGKHFAFFAWNRALSDAEMQAVTANPWQLFAPQSIEVPYYAAITTPVPQFKRFREELIPWTSQPQETAQPSADLSLASLILPGQSNFDLVSGNPLSTRSGTVTESVGPLGPQLNFSAAQSAIYRTASERQRNSTQASIVWAGTLLSVGSSTDACLGGITYDSANAIPYVHIQLKRETRGNNTSISLTWADSTTFRYLDSGVSILGTGPVVIVGTVKAGEQVLLIKQGGNYYRYTSAVAQAMAPADATARVEIGDSLNFRNTGAGCAVYADADVAWSEAQARTVLDDLWGKLFAPQSVEVPYYAAITAAPELQFKRFREELIPWTSQPQEATEVASKLELTSLFSATSEVDLVSGMQLAYIGPDISKGVGTLGRIADWKTPTGLSSINLSNNPFANNIFSAVALVYVSSRPPDTATIFASAEPSSINTSLQFRLSNTGAIQLCKPGSAVVRTSTLIVPLNKLCVVGITMDALSGVLNFYLDGVEDAFLGAIQTAYTHGPIGTIGANFNDFAYNWRGSIALLAYSSKKQWSKEDHVALANNPWQVFTDQIIPVPTYSLAVTPEPVRTVRLDEREYPWYSQPQEASGINTSTGLVKGLALLYSNGVDHVSGAVPTPVGTVSNVVTEQGPAIGPTGTTANYATLPFSRPLSFFDNGMTVLVTSRGGNGSTVASRSPSGVESRYLEARSADTGGDFWFLTGQRFQLGNISALLNTGVNCAALTSSGVHYVNGRFNPTSYIGNYGDNSQGIEQIVLQGNPLAGRSSSSDLLVLAIWNRILTGEELASATSNPWQLFTDQIIPVPAYSFEIQPSYRPNNDVETSGWVGTPDNATLYTNINELTPDDASYIASTSTVSPVSMGLTPSVPPGRYDVTIRAAYEDVFRKLRVVMLDDSNTVLATSSWQNLTIGYATYLLNIVLSQTATRFRIEVST